MMLLRSFALFLLTFSLPLFADKGITVIESVAAPVVEEGEVSGFDFRAYRFHARAGQYYHVELDNAEVDFSLLPVKRGGKIPSGAEGYMPEDGEYELRILQNRDAAQSGQTSRYRLTLTVNDQQSDTADAASQSSQIQFTQGSIAVAENGRLYGKAEDSYRFFANQGQRLRVSMEGEGVFATLRYLGRENPELDSREQILPYGGQYELRLALNRAAARSKESRDYRFTLALDSVADSAPITATAPASIPIPQRAMPVAQDAAEAAASTASADKSFFLHYRCAGAHDIKVHYTIPADAAARATLYFDDKQFHMEKSARHSTPLQAVFYGRGHYLTLNTPAPIARSELMSFVRREGDNEEILLTQCQPR